MIGTKFGEAIPTSREITTLREHFVNAIARNDEVKLFLRKSSNKHYHDSLLITHYSALITHYSALVTQHSAPAERRATANSTHYPASLCHKNKNTGLITSGKFSSE
ncbi:hypothetical protein [Nostoc sp. CMAA1605]|uniref:hypothetical protein n=1 Tax=Nostoc sp. CMAA1605 TaxID=2055159 RepID=UPI001F1A6609|nr:hypothetical protein [Nostoc sp. CMAA1605]